MVGEMVMGQLSRCLNPEGRRSEIGGRRIVALQLNAPRLVMVKIAEGRDEISAVIKSMYIHPSARANPEMKPA